MDRKELRFLATKYDVALDDAFNPFLKSINN